MIWGFVHVCTRLQQFDTVFAYNWTETMQYNAVLTSHAHTRAPSWHESPYIGI